LRFTSLIADFAYKIQGYEAYFNPCRDKDQGLGFNGVAVYVRKGAKGVSCRKAEWRALGDEELDRMGRCIMTDHGEFVLFNVYAPCSGGASGMIKMRFHDALGRAMEEQREKGRKVVLVGDLNIAHKAIDTHCNHRRIRVDKILEMGELAEQWMRDIKEKWILILDRLRTTREVVSQITTNSRTGEKHNKWR